MFHFYESLLVILALTTCIAFGATGKCGDNCTWSTSGTSLTLSGKGKISKSGWSKSITEVVIKSGLTEIKDNLFQGYTSLKSVTLPNTLKEIGDYCFSGCTKLVSVNGLNHVKEVEDYAFKGCTSLTSASPTSATKIGDYAFSGCTSLQSVSATSATDMGDYAFSQCTSLETASIKCSSVKRSYFSGCKNLETLKVTGATTIESSAFSGFTKLQSVTSSVSTVGSSAFSGCSSLSSFSFSNVWTIGQNAFHGCSSLASALLSSVRTIGTSAFGACTRLSTVTIGSHITSISSEAFSGCTSLQSITIPKPIYVINSNTFQGCTSLVEVNLPTSLTTIQANAFNKCTALETITIPSSVNTLSDSAFAGCTKLEQVIYRGTTNPVSSGNPFEGCDALEYVCVPMSYGSSKFGENTVYPKGQSPELQEIREEQNCCYEGFACNESFGFLLERENATEWINQESQCSDYYCDNATGPEKWHICNTTMYNSLICIEEKCVANTTVKSKGWTVQLTFENVTTADFDEDKFLTLIHDLSDIDKSSITLGTEIENDGTLERAYLILGSQTKADNLANKIKEIIGRSECNYGVLCQTVEVVVFARIEPSSANYIFESMFVLFLALIVSIFSLLK